MENEEKISSESTEENCEAFEEIDSLVIGSEEVLNFIQFLKHGQRVTAEDRLLVKEMNSKQQDLLHDLEIPDKLYVRDITYLAKELRTLRRNRRQIKDELLLAEQIDSFLKSHPHLIEELHDLAALLQEKETFLQDRHYTVKSTLITTTAIENKKLKEEENKILLIVNKILKKWSPRYEAVYENCETSVSGLQCHNFSFWLTNTSYDFSAAKSTLNNFLMIFEKEIKSMYENVEASISVSNMTLDDPNKRTSRLMAVYTITVKDSHVYKINGAINFKYKKPKTNQSRKKGKKRR